MVTINLILLALFVYGNKCEMNYKMQWKLYKVDIPWSGNLSKLYKYVRISKIGAKLSQKKNTKRGQFTADTMKDGKFA